MEMGEEKEEAKKKEEEEEKKKKIVFNSLYDATMKNEWEKVVEILKKEGKEYDDMKLTKSLDTALHVAIYNYHPKTPSSSSSHILPIIEAMKGKGTLQGVLAAQNERGDTPLHLAAALGWLSIFKTAIDEKYPATLFEIRNSMGETPFFIAALHGRTNIFRLLRTTLKPDKNLAWRNDGNTILHVAVFEENFELAYEILEYYPELVNRKNEDGESPLHVLAKKQNVFKSSSHLRLYDTIIYHCVFVDKLVIKEEINDYTAEATKSTKYPENYVTCANMITSLRSTVEIIGGELGKASLTSYISKNPNRPTSRIDQHHKQNTPQPQSCVNKCPNPPTSQVDEENQQNAPQSQNAIAAIFKKRLPTCGTDEENLYHQRHPPRTNEENGDTSYHYIFPPNYATCVNLFKFAMKVLLVLLGVGFWRIQKIREKKKRYLNALEVLDKMLRDESTYKFDYDGGGQQPQIDPRTVNEIKIPNERPVFDVEDICDDTSSSKPSPSPSPSPSKENAGNKAAGKEGKAEVGGFAKNDSPVVVAAKMGILEMVKRIRNKCPVAIQDLDSDKKNVVMLAAQHRHTAVFDYLCRDANLPEYMFHHFDKDKNSILHLAAKLENTELYPWRIPGAALQMQWEIKWYKHVKESIPSQSISHPNKKGKTPRNIFSVTHKDLKKAGNEWLIKTSESCSVVAALIAAVAFATSSTVPGGLDQNQGKPVLQHEQAFDVFAVASLVALCLSVTALVFFLAIITSRCEERDFKRNLPSKLLAGLSSLFASIAAILLSFCSGHIFVLREELRFAVIPIYGSITIPIAFFAIAQLPLYFDLLWAAYTKVPLRSYKAFSY